MNGIYSRLGWSLTAIYFCPFSPPQSRENIRNAVHFTVRFVAAPKTNPGTGGNAGLIESRATLKLASFALAGHSCYRRSDDFPEKVMISTAL